MEHRSLIRHDKSPSRQREPGFNFSRKIFHFVGLLIPFSLEIKAFHSFDGYFTHPTLLITIFLVFVILLAIVAIDTLRLHYPRFNALFYRLASGLVKEEERERYTGMVPYLFACLLLLLFASQPIVILSCIFLVLADTCAAYIGIFYGRLRLANGKSIEGSLAFVFSSLVFGALYFAFRNFTYGPQDSFSLFGFAGINWAALFCLFTGACFSALAETFSPTLLRGLFDDNFTAPIAGALGIFLSACFLAGYPLSDLLSPLVLDFFEL